MRAAVLAGAPDRVAAARRLIEGTGVKLPVLEIPPEAAAGKIREARSGLLLSPGLIEPLRRDLGLNARLLLCRTEETNLVVVTGMGAAHAAYSFAAMNARLKITVARDAEDPGFAPAALEAARDYPQLVIEERDAASLPREIAEDPGAFDLLLCGAKALGGILAAVPGSGEAVVLETGERCSVIEAPGTPAGLVRATALLLEHLNEPRACERVLRTLRPSC